MKAMTGSTDPVKVYLNQMSEVSPISPEEEQVLAGTLEACRKTLRDHVLAAGIPLMRAIEMLEKVHSREVPIDRVLLVDVGSNEQKDEIYAALDESLPELQKSLKIVQRDFRAYLSRDLPNEKRLKLRKLIRSKLVECVGMLDRFNIQVSRLFPMVLEVQGALRKMKSARRRLTSLQLRAATGAALDSATKEFEDAQIESLATPKALRRYVEDVAAQRVSYDEAKKRLSQKNLRLVVSVAKRFRERGLPFLDLIQEGNVGLMKALDRYQASRGNKFSTYATWWIKQTITRSLAAQSRTVRIPVHAINNLNRLVEAKETFIKDHGREATLEELADLTKLPLPEVNRLLELNRTSFSLDQPHYAEEEGNLGDLIEDEKSPTPLEVSYRNQLRDRLKKIMRQLNHREREVLKLRFGLDGGHTHTLEELGQMFKVSRERIRQVEVGALQKLQLPVCKEKLETFWREINAA